MAFRLGDVIIDDIQSALVRNDESELLYVLQQCKNDSVEPAYDCPVTRDKIEEAVRILNSKQEVFDVDKLAFVLAKCKKENITFAEVSAMESCGRDINGMLIRKIYTRKEARVYYPYVYIDVYYPYERDGDYLIVRDERMISTILSLMDENAVPLPEQKKVEHNHRAKAEFNIDDVSRTVDALYCISILRSHGLRDEKTDNAYDALNNHLKEMVYSDEPGKPEEPLDVNSLKGFISKIGISIARLKSEAEHSSYTEFFEQLQNIIDLERIMNDAIKLLKE